MFKNKLATSHIMFTAVSLIILDIILVAQNPSNK